MTGSNLQIVIIGSGNVATHLARGFYAAGCRIAQVFSRDIDHARRLADEFEGTQAIDSFSDIRKDADFYLIALTDAAVSVAAAEMPRVSGVVAHTSGSVPLETLKDISASTAVLYPLQTFTRDARVNLSGLPFFTEASDAATLAFVDRMAGLLSDNVYHADSRQRKTLHIAGVLSCNFVNYLWDCTADVLSRDGYDFKVVEPLIKATLDKAVAIGPHASQTGPAMRGDTAVINEHASLLDPVNADLYLRLSQAIINKHKQ